MKHSGFSRIPKPPPPPSSSHRGNNDNQNKSSANHQFIKPSNHEKDVRPKHFNTSGFKTSKLFDSDTFKEINEIENRKSIEKINKIKSWFLEKNNN